MSVRPADHPERGAGTVLVLGIVAASIAFVLLLLPFLGISITRHRAMTAADAAALAAADARIGLVTGDPCARAAAVAGANGARLERCVVDGLVATVRVAIPTWAGAVVADATAGPPRGA